MNEDVTTTEHEEDATEDASEELEEAALEGEPDTADEIGDEGGGAGMLGPIEIPSTGRMLVGLGGAAMALSTLLSWLKSGPDSFPNVSGIGSSTIGIGLTVFIVGLALLVRRRSVGVTAGMALGAFAITLIFIVLIGTDSGILAFGVWLALAGSSVAVLGALQSAFEEEERPTLDFHSLPAALGAALAVAASFLLDWLGSPINGVDSDVLFGLPVLILGGIALVLTVELMSVPRMVMEGRRQALLMIGQAAGVGIVVVAGSNVVAMTVFGNDVFGSGPLVALVGGIMLTRSIRRANQ